MKYSRNHLLPMLHRDHLLTKIQTFTSLRYNNNTTTPASMHRETVLIVLSIYRERGPWLYVRYIEREGSGCTFDISTDRALVVPSIYRETGLWLYLRYIETRLWLYLRYIERQGSDCTFDISRDRALVVPSIYLNRAVTVRSIYRETGL
jgi:hypothetical protein